MPRISTGVEGGAVVDGVAAIVEHGADFAVHVADDEVVAVPQRAVLDQHGRHWTAAAIELGFEHHAGCGALGSRLQLLQVGDQADHFHQQIKVGLLLCGNVHENCLAAPLFRNQAAIGELLLHAFGQCASACRSC